MAVAFEQWAELLQIGSLRFGIVDRRVDLKCEKDYKAILATVHSALCTHFVVIHNLMSFQGCQLILRIHQLRTDSVL